MSAQTGHSARTSASFAPTQWSAVRRASTADDPGSAQALAALCQSYWHPIYAYIRRAGKSAHDAEDLTQGFFVRLIEKNLFATAERDKGKLRSFLLTCLKRYLADEYDRKMAQKRGAGVTNFSLEWAEECLAKEPVDDMTPDRLYQRRWALTLLEVTILILKQQYEENGEAGLFEALRPFLGFSSKVESYDALAKRLDMNLNSLKSAIHRLREAWREVLMNQIASTLENPTPQNIKAELSELRGWI